MSQYTEPELSGTGGPAEEPSTADVARAQAADVGQHAREAGGQVAETAADQARQVAAETGRQARDLLYEAQGHARKQASAQQERAALQLHSLADELQTMAANGGQSGLATEVARQAATRIHDAASWLDQREPADLLEEVRDFARRRTGVFLIGAAVAGLAAGRLTRGLTANANREPEPGRGTVSGVPAATTPHGGVPGDVAGYPADAPYADAPYAAGVDSVPPAAAAYPDQPTFTPREDYAGAYPEESSSPADPAYPVDPAYPPEPGTTTGYEEEPR
jgi:hypothetical protein